MDHDDLLITQNDLNAMRSTKYCYGIEKQDLTKHGLGQ